MYTKDFEKFKEYNIKDVQLLRDLDKKTNMIGLMIKECEWTGSFLDRFYIGELLDNYILRRSKALGTFQHSKPDFEESKSYANPKIRGGFVMKPVVGLHENVRIFDFKSLYPTIIVGFNIGQDTLNEELSHKGFDAFCNFLNVGTPDERKIEDVEYDEWKAFLAEQKKLLDPENKYIQTGNNAFFAKDRQSFVSDLIKYFLTERSRMKKEVKNYPPGSPEAVNLSESQLIVKEMANSMFGITCDKTSRYFNLYVSEAITLTGQFMNRTASKIAHDLGYETIYGDSVHGSSVVRFGNDTMTVAALWRKHRYRARKYHDDKEAIQFHTPALTASLTKDAVLVSKQVSALIRVS